MHIPNEQKLFLSAVSELKKALILVLSLLFASGPAHAQNPKNDGPVEEAEGPIKESESPGSILVLPTLTISDTGSDAATFDVLLAANFQEMGFQVVDEITVIEKHHPMDVSLDQAKEAYLDMRLEESLDMAEKVRNAHLAHHGDLLSDEALLETDLFIIQLMLNLDRETEARDLAVEILLRHPDLTLDPESYSPAMQSLWLSAGKRMKGRQPQLPQTEILAEIGREVDVDWVASAMRKTSIDNEDLFVVLLVPTAENKKSSRHFTVLGSRAEWSTDIRQALHQRFPPPVIPEIVPLPMVLPPGEGEEDGAKKKKWYKTWWFWAGVGVVVVGGAALAIGLAARNQDENPPVTWSGS